METWVLVLLVLGWWAMAVMGAYIAEWKGHSFVLNLLGGVFFPFLWPLVIPALLDYSEPSGGDRPEDGSEE